MIYILWHIIHISTDQDILRKLEKEKILVFTPSRRVQGRRVVCYDDRFIVKLAFDSDGIIVSNDNYRDLQVEKPEWKKFIEENQHSLFLFQLSEVFVLCNLYGFHVHLYSLEIIDG